MNNSGVTGGGVSRLNWTKFNRDVDRKGFVRLGYVPTKYGQVYLAERFDVTHWTMMWLARDMTQEIECVPESSAKARKQEVLNAAFHHLFVRAESFGEA